MPRRTIITLAALAILALAAVVLRLLIAPDGLSLPPDDITLSLRASRACSGLVVGAALALAGVLLQALLRNPLAEPAVLGITAGAGLGVVIGVYAGYLATGSLVQHRPPAIEAFTGALATLAIVGLLGQRRGVLDPVSLILIGVVVGLICGAATLFVQHLMPDQGLATAVRWLIGALRDDVSWTLIIFVGALTLAALGVCVALGPAMDAASLSDDEARAVGAPLSALRAILFVLSGALTAGAVLIAGPIGFVGLVCPHAVRLLIGPSHRALAIGSALLGGGAIVAADAAIRVLEFGAGRMPLGVVTALIGGPVFIALLRRVGASR